MLKITKTLLLSIAIPFSPLSPLLIPPAHASDVSGLQVSQEKKTALVSWASQIRNKIEGQRLKWDWTAPGRVIKVRFTVRSDGSVKAVDILRSSGKESIDKFYKGAIRKAEPFPRAPAILGSDEFTFSLSFDLGDPGTIFRPHLEDNAYGR